MGTYFNPNNGSFREDSGSRIYIDKTGLLNELNQVIGTSEKCISLSHARRFGKSQAAGMMDAYYSLGSDSRELFSKFEIAKAPDFEEHLNKYNVIHLDISSVADFHKDDLIQEIDRRLKNDFYEIYRDELDYTNDINLLINDIYKKSGNPFVIIIDEWDCVVRNHSDRPDLVHKYLQFLHSLFKSEESKSYLALAYITGILPIKKIQDESALNNFREYTMISSKRLTPYFGFTEDEVKGLCQKYEMDFDSVKEWYDGYTIDGMHMYNPNSVYQSMIDRSLESYWKNTSAFSTINDLITLNFDGLKEDIIEMLSGGRAAVDTETFQNDLSIIESKDEALTALIHLGYLGYDKDEGEAFIPNFEVARAYHAALKKSSWKEIAKMVYDCEHILKATIRGEADKVAELLERSHDMYTSVLKYNDENSLSCAITMAYYAAPAYYTVVRELPAGKGFTDLVFIPRKEAGSRPAMIIELKWDDTADTAIKQIKERRYTGALAGYEKEILLVGISYNKDSESPEYKKHYCVIEKAML